MASLERNDEDEDMRFVILSLCFLLKFFLSLLHMDILNLPWVEALGWLVHLEEKQLSRPPPSPVSVKDRSK